MKVATLSFAPIFLAAGTVYSRCRRQKSERRGQGKFHEEMCQRLCRQQLRSKRTSLAARAGALSIANPVDRLDEFLPWACSSQSQLQRERPPPGDRSSEMPLYGLREQF
jgi:hypothetical protein